ncbi:hypothetical protein SAMN05421854_110200 [Amycolatopsis rubida]|uniref:Uncharacterized protein n=2 Tax=Amycolatopsis rubida TaxID=112413 RepID=A0A1I5XFM6_9PSEU|nr:hypothetical protein SAMN05421854_110200 [Amycolatopsis rubida]
MSGSGWRPSVGDLVEYPAAGGQDALGTVDAITPASSRRPRAQIRETGQWHESSSLAPAPDPRTSVDAAARARLADWLRRNVRYEGGVFSILRETHPRDLRAMMEWDAVVEDADGNARIHPAFYAGLLHAADLIEINSRGPRIMAETDPPDSGVLYGCGHPISGYPLPQD